MNTFEQNLLQILKELKEKFCVVGLKIEFGEEAALVEDAQFLKKISFDLGLEFTIKIGGCEAVGDIKNCLLIRSNSIVAPMIESPYAAKKFVNSTKTVYAPFMSQTPKLYINIETQYGFNYVEDILNSDFSNCIAGIVFGRTDFAKSLDQSVFDTDSMDVLEFALKTSLCAKKYNKEFIIGGNVSPRSISFFKEIPYLNKIETRNVIFDANSLLNETNTETALLKAIEFEILYLKNKQNVSGEDLKRISLLEKRINVCK